VDKIHRQIVRYKGKRIDRWQGHISNKRPDDEMPALDQDTMTAIAEETERKIVRTKKFQVVPMTDEEAVEQMELLGHDFFVFYNVNLGRINVLYRRADKNYGLLDPELA
jgi:putative sigma-54 modulation protein